MDETILTLHPDLTKKGVRISKHKYDLVKSAIENALSGGAEMTFSELGQAVEKSLANAFDGSISW